MIAGAQPLALSAAELALIESFRKADQRGRESIVEHALSTAEDWPADDRQK
jgi:hypothetical protein